MEDPTDYDGRLPGGDPHLLLALLDRWQRHLDLPAATTIAQLRARLRELTGEVDA